MLGRGWHDITPCVKFTDVIHIPISAPSQSQSPMTKLENRQTKEDRAEDKH